MELDQSDEIFDEILNTNDDQLLRDGFSLLLNNYEVINFVFGSGSIFWRGRICQEKDPFQFVDDLGSPPASLCKVGRLNDASQPVLYLATRESTALSEIGVISGCHAHLSGYWIRQGEKVTLAAVGEYFNIYKSGRSKIIDAQAGTAISSILNAMPKEEARRTLYIDAFFAQILSDPSAAKTGYVKTRILWSLIREKLKLDGIFYPSVKDYIGLNLAIMAESASKKMKLVSSNLYRVDAVRRFSIYDGHIVSAVTGIGDGGKLIFQPARGGLRFVFSNDVDDIKLIAAQAEKRGAKVEAIEVERDLSMEGD